MDSQYTAVTDPVYDYISIFVDETARVVIDGKWGMIDKNGDVRLTIEYDYISSPLSKNICSKYGIPAISCIIKNGKMGFVDTTGKVLL